MDSPKHLVGRIGATLRAVAAHEPRGATTSEVARGSGLARATTHRLLTSMLDQGLTDRTDDGRWLLGPELYLLGTSASARYDVTALAQPFVRQLATETGESAFFSVRRGSETVCLVREEGSFPLRSHVLYEGVRFPLGVASAGLVILAFMPPREAREYLESADLVPTFGPKHTQDLIQSRIRATRRVGYAVNPGLVVEGSWGMAAAVFDALGQPVGALSLTGVAHRFGRDRQHELGRFLLGVAHALATAAAPG